MKAVELPVEIYPQEANLSDSLSEFYLKMEMKDQAGEFYKKTLEENPNFPNAENAGTVLKKLETP